MQVAHAPDGLPVHGCAFYLYRNATRIAAPHDTAAQRPKGTAMTKRNTFTRIGDMIATFGSAVAAAHAVEAGRRPRASDLAALGIEPKAFEKIGRYY
jgi:hypothetical protein